MKGRGRERVVSAPDAGVELNAAPNDSVARPSEQQPIPRV